jgi:hypothetical protein
VLIECNVRYRGELVRRALFRETLARTNQLALFGDDAPVNPEAKLFAILLHGAEDRFPDRLAFADIAFPGPDCSEYFDTIDLLGRFPDLAREVLPDLTAAPVAKPLPRLRPMEDERPSEDR